jgi:hypothetical protein
MLWFVGVKKNLKMVGWDVLRIVKLHVIGSAIKILKSQARV